MREPCSLLPSPGVSAMLTKSGVKNSKGVQAGDQSETLHQGSLIAARHNILIRTCVRYVRVFVYVHTRLCPWLDLSHLFSQLTTNTRSGYPQCLSLPAEVFHYICKRYTVSPTSTQSESETLTNEMKRGL